MSLLMLRESWCRRWACRTYIGCAIDATISTRRWTSTRSYKPLRILFCGSDDFSCASLRAVHGEHQANPDSIASIDVMCRPGKLSGRGMKTIREVPIKGVARELGLRVCEQDTFTGWNLPRSDINLIIAVSFGLFVPPRILRSAEYGGINVHPSLLPEYRGPAPLHHVLLAGESHTGVTLQTLHPEKFDHGAILAQTPRPGLEIPNSSTCTFPQLLDFISPIAAEILVQGIRDRVFVPPIKDLTSTLPWQDPATLRHAPKITTEDRYINWETMTASEICRRGRALDRLWAFYQPQQREQRSRLIFHGLEVVDTPQKLLDWQKTNSNVKNDVHKLPVVGQDGKPCDGVPYVEDGGRIVVLTEGGEALLIREITKEGESRKIAAGALANL